MKILNSSNMKNSFSLLEIILTLIISSILIIYSTIYAKELFYTNKENQKNEINKINLNSTKIFIETHKNELNQLSYTNNNLYFKNSLLLENVKIFDIKKDDKKINVFINLADKIVQVCEINL